MTATRRHPRPPVVAHPVEIHGGWRIRSTTQFHVDVLRMISGNLRLVTTPLPWPLEYTRSWCYQVPLIAHPRDGCGTGCRVAATDTPTTRSTARPGPHSSNPHTRAYVTRQVAAGRTKPEIIRLLKRAIAREVHRHLTRVTPVLICDDLRPARQAKNITRTAVAHHVGVWPSAISRIERGLQRHDQPAEHYRGWLTAA